MTRERIIELMSTYRESLAALRIGTQKLLELNVELDRLMATRIDDAVSTTQIISDMPRGTMTGDKTARIALGDAQEEYSFDIRQIRHEIDDLKNELMRLRKEVNTVQSLVEMLTEENRLIVVSRYIEDEPWNTVLQAVEQRFGKKLSRQGIMKRCDTILERMVSVVSRFIE